MRVSWRERFHLAHELVLRFDNNAALSHRQAEAEEKWSWEVMVIVILVMQEGSVGRFSKMKLCSTVYVYLIVRPSHIHSSDDFLKLRPTPILFLTSRTTVTLTRFPEEDACHRVRNLCVFSHVQKGTPRLTHKGYIFAACILVHAQ